MTEEEKKYSHIEFLRKRGVDESLIKVLEEEKIDIDTVNLLEEDSLSKYLPRLGDRVMLKDYCRSHSKKTTASKKDSLFTMLKKKMKPFEQRKYDDSGDSRKPSCSKQINKNAVKSSRKIELGWIHEGRTLRKTSGGGTRKVTLDKRSVNHDICENGKSIFFPDGKSPKGNAELFNFSVLDYQRVLMPDGVTIGEVQDLSKMSGYLRFYISTTKKHGPESTATQETVNLDFGDDVQLPVSMENSIDETIIFAPSTSTPTLSILADTIPLSGSDISLPSPVSNGSNDSLERLINDPLPTDIVQQAMALEGIEERFQQDGNPTQNVNTSVIEIRVHRGQVFKDLISFFKQSSVCMDNKYEMKMVLPDGKVEAGEDNGGIFRDGLSEFWETFYETCTLGETVRVPATIHTMKEDDWEAVCKVIYIGFKQQQVFPNRIAIPFIRYCMTGDSKGTSSEELLSVFLGYLAEMDEEVLRTAIDDFDAVETDDLHVLLSSLDVRTSPTKDNIKTVLTEVAHKKLVQDPAFVADCWRPLFRAKICSLLNSDIDKLYASLTPSVKKLLSLLVFPEESVMSREQMETKTHWQQFIKSLSGPMQEKFLRFCTGSNIVIRESITIRFIEPASLFSRRPVAHTCGCVLELPYNYQNYIEFRQEFTAVLESNIWIMDFI